MDHVSANKTLTVTERENISGARVFDGEDQGKNHFKHKSILVYKRLFHHNQHLLTFLLFDRRWQQISHAAVTAERLVRATDKSEVPLEGE